ncbi:MAG: flavin reductase family protein [Actinomycetales bacterium]|nr:flavin reductase family protein [Actinomycetales bacterium]
MSHSDDFKAAFRNHPAGVAVLTADSGDGPVGLTVTSVSSVSANPPMLMFSLSGHSSSGPALKKAETVIVHLLGEEQVELAKTFATSGIDRFADESSWSRLETGEPFLPSAATWMRGKVVNQMEAGESTVIVIEILQVNLPAEGEDAPQDSRPLVYHNRTWHSLGEAQS